MKDEVIERLFASFEELENAIEHAKRTLYSQGNEVPREVIQRLESYDSILVKQRDLAKSLCEYIDLGKWNDVRRVIDVINGLSEMIQDDAEGILSVLNDDTNSFVGDSFKHSIKRNNYC